MRRYTDTFTQRKEIIAVDFQQFLEMDSASFLGDTIQLECGEKGTYRGRVKGIDSNTQSITISEVSLNGICLAVAELTISGEHVKDLKIIHHQQSKELTLSPREEAEPSGKRRQRSPRNSRKGKSPEPSSSARRLSLKNPEKPVDKTTYYKKKDDQCFGNTADSPTMPDFDIEANLALFDKHAIFEELKKDSVQIGDSNLPVTIRKMKGNENVLESEPVSLRQIKVPLEHVGKEYTTDNGFIVPAISLELRRRLFVAADAAGLSLQQRVENAGICTCQMSLQLVGGELRINPKNAHQVPEIVVLAGPHVQGLQGICAARHLANHTAKVKLFVPERSLLSQSQLDLFVKTGGTIVRTVQDLPSQPVDLVIDALCGHDDSDLIYDWLSWAIQWANQNRAPVLSLDPCVRTTRPVTIETKWSLALALPLISSPKVGRLYLADVGIPRGVFKEVGVSYMSPFTDKFFIPLND